MASDPVRIAVVGGGIAGLAAAWEWVPYMRDGTVRVSLFESRDRFGGLIRTDRRSGLIIEGGPDSFLARKPEARELARAVGLGDHIIGTRPDIRGAYIYHGGRLHPIPAGLQAGIPSDLGPLVRSRLLSPWGKFRAAWDLWLPRVLPRDGRDVSVGWFLRRRFGSEVVVRLAEPMLSGIYAADIDRLSLAATFPRLAEVEHRSRSLILGLGRGGAPPPPRPAGSPPPSLFQTLDTGLETLVETLAARLKAEGAVLERGRPVEALSVEGNGYRVELGAGDSRPFEAVILATPAYVTARLLGALDPRLGALHDQIPYSNLAVVGLGYRAETVPRPLDKTGYLIPRDAGFSTTAVTWLNAKWQHQHQSDLVPMRSFLGRSGGPDVLELDDQALLGLARHDLAATMGLEAEPVYHVLFRWRRALPQYLVGHVERVREIRRRLEAWPGLTVAGAAYDGPGVPDCIASARTAAAAVARALGLPAPSRDAPAPAGSGPRGL